jgi:predicted helicase
VTAPDPAIHPSGPSFSPEDVFHYIYAVLHSPTYRSRYAEVLKIDFPRIPLPGGPEIFDALVPLGAELVALHLMESPRLNQHMTTFQNPLSRPGGEGAGGEGPRVEKVSFTLTPNPSPSEGRGGPGTVWIDKAQTISFKGVPEEVWNFHIGGYQVCEKWLKDRGPKKGNPGRILSPQDIDHYHRIVVALSETIRIMKDIDIAIETHGGWPGAFSAEGA